MGNYITFNAGDAEIHWKKSHTDDPYTLMNPNSIVSVTLTPETKYKFKHDGHLVAHVWTDVNGSIIKCKNYKSHYFLTIKTLQTPVNLSLSPHFKLLDDLGLPCLIITRRENLRPDV